VLHLDDLDTWVRACSQRAELFRRIMPMAFENLAIAQHRDTLRYATIRGGGYRPSIRRFHPGDYVYLQQTAPTTLDVTAGRIILRVRRVLPSGVLVLEGRDGMEWKDHVRNCAPCHLPNIDDSMDPSLAIVPVGLRCMLCGSARGAATMLICDGCSRGWHMSCLTPSLDSIPESRWLCPKCT
jgi:PHD-finger